MLYEQRCAQNICRPLLVKRNNRKDFRIMLVKLVQAIVDIMAKDIIPCKSQLHAPMQYFYHIDDYCWIPDTWN